MDVIALFTARKIFKQVYPATYNFKDDADGAFPSGWTDQDGVGCETTVIASLDGHKKVIQMSDNSAVNRAQMVTFPTQELNAKIELYIGKNSIAANTTFEVNFFEGGTRLVRLLFNDDDLDYHVGIIKENFMVANKLIRLKVILNDTANTFDCYINGILEGDDLAYENNSTSGFNALQIRTDSTDTGFIAYVESVGFSSDPLYNIGDNAFWRHYKETTDSFEGDDVGTQGTSITWVDGTDNADDNEIVQEFNEHKKILRTYINSGTGYSRHNFPTVGLNGWISTWVKVADANAINEYAELREGANIRLTVRIDVDRFEYRNRAGAWVDVGKPAVDATWYFVYIQWYSDSTFDLWVNNVQYLDGVQTFSAFTGTGISRWYVDQDTAGANYIYINSPMSSLDGDTRADNRTFDYLPYTYNDVTSNIVKCEVSEVEYDPSTAIIHDDTQLTITDLHIVQLYDENSDLRFEGLLEDQNQPGVQNKYFLNSLNRGELKDQITYAASAAGDVNYHLLLIHTNVGQADGRLIYYAEDDPAGDITPNYRNRPTKDADRWLAAHGNKVLIIKPNGVCFLDDDRNPSAGAATITGTSTSLLAPPYSIHTITNQINRVEVFGAIDPDTGTPFSGVSEDTAAQADGTGIIKYYKRFRELQSDLDCQNRAIAIRTGTGFKPQLLSIHLKGIYALPGEIINFAYSDRSFSATNCFVEAATYNLVQGICTYTLNTGIFDAIGMAQPQFSYAAEGSDDIVDTLRKTDINTVYPEVIEGGGATKDNLGVRINAIGEDVTIWLYLSNQLDVSRDINIFLMYNRVDPAPGVVNITKYLTYASMGGGTNTVYWNNVADTLPAVGNWDVKQFTFPGGVLASGNKNLRFRMDSNNGVMDIFVVAMAVVYYIKRSI